MNNEEAYRKVLEEVEFIKSDGFPPYDSTVHFPMFLRERGFSLWWSHHNKILKRIVEHLTNNPEDFPQYRPFLTWAVRKIFFDDIRGYDMVKNYENRKLLNWCIMGAIRSTNSEFLRFFAELQNMDWNDDDETHMLAAALDSIAAYKNVVATPYRWQKHAIDTFEVLLQLFVKEPEIRPGIYDKIGTLWDILKESLVVQNFFTEMGITKERCEEEMY